MTDRRTLLLDAMPKKGCPRSRAPALPDGTIDPCFPMIKERNVPAVPAFQHPFILYQVENRRFMAPLLIPLYAY
jgi:hypothetical protein